MKQATKSLIVCLYLIIFCTSFIAEPTGPVDDFKLLTGDKWIGHLRYLDYSSGKPVTIKADLLVTQSATDPYVFYWQNLYPDEPHENSTDTIVLRSDGSMIGSEIIMERKEQKNLVSIVTQKLVQEAGASKVYRYAYQISSNSLVIRKEELEKENTFLERNTYFFRRN